MGIADPLSCRTSALVVLLVLSCVLGCGKRQSDLYSISGTITYMGKPVPAGIIAFESATKDGEKVTHSRSEIVDGKYSISAKGGHKGGVYAVFINGFDGNAEDTSGESEFGRSLFRTHRHDCELPLSDHIMDIEIPQDRARQ